MKHGIYQIRNVINNKCYIGSTAIGFRERWCDHKKNLRGCRHINRYLQNAWNKYGEESFIFEILLICDPENCLFYEQIYLDFYKPEYNICKVAGSRLGIGLSDEAKEKISKANRGKLAGDKNPMYGRSGILAPMFGKKHHNDTKLKMRENHLGSKNPMAILDENKVRKIKELKKEGLSQHKRAEMFGVSRSTIKNIDIGDTWSWIE